MSEKDEERPVIEVTEESWEEDTGEVDFSNLEEAFKAPKNPGGYFEGVRSEGEALTAPEVEIVSAAPTLIAAEVQLREPSVVSDADSVFSDSEPPPRGLSPILIQPSLSVGEHLRRARRIGTGIWYSGVFLWAYLIVGELVVGVGLPEVLGWSAFVGVVVGAFLHGANRIGISAMRKAASISIGSVGIGVFLIAILAGSSVRSEYQALSLVLLIAAVALIFWGLRYSRGGLPKLAGPTGMRWSRLALWILFLGHTALIAAMFLN